MGYSQFAFLFIRKLRALDATKFQVQFCISLLGMLVVYLIGVTRNENEIVCTLMSALLQYFVLSSTLWMVAQGVLMFKKLVLVFGIISKRFLVIVSLLCWCKRCTSSPIIIVWGQRRFDRVKRSRIITVKILACIPDLWTQCVSN